MKATQVPKQGPYRKNSCKENSKSSYYNSREEQKPTYNFIQQTKLRIVQDNLVSVSGLSTQYDNPNLLADNQHFGKYGTVDKIIISTQGKYKSAFIQVYITYEKSLDAALAIRAMDGIKIDGRQLSATYGTTKYCTYFLKQNECKNQKCFYLHNYDTKNELVDGVKNNLDFLYQKSQNMINVNLKYFVQKQLQQKEQKQESEFPTISQTLQYLIEQGMLKQQHLNKLRKQVQQEALGKRKKSSSMIVTSNGNQAKNSSSNSKQLSNQKQQKQAVNSQPYIKQSNRPQSSIFQNIVLDSNQEKSLSDCSNRSNDSDSSTNKQQRNVQQTQLLQLTNKVKQIEMKNRKCNSLSTASSPTKYQKLDNIEQESIDKTIERRLIKQIMRNNMVFRSRMDFVTQISTHGKEQNNKMKNYVRKHLLNQI